VLYLAYVRLIALQPIADRTPLMLLGISLILGGVQLVMTGLLGEMLSRTYHESQDKPTYLIREVLDADLPQESERPARIKTGIR
jgi:hypothetical protein